MINEDGTCSCCGKIVKRNKETGKVYTKEEIDTINNKNKDNIIKYEPKAINTKNSMKEDNKKVWG